jgi:hypothetical protein
MLEDQVSTSRVIEFQVAEVSEGELFRVETIDWTGTT